MEFTNVESMDGQFQMGAGDNELVRDVLVALAAMAVRSKRRQADVGAALRRGRVKAESDRVIAALQLLEQRGCVEAMVPTYDGGILLSVTGQGMESIAPYGRHGTGETVARHA
jgi:hypothetical protein